MLKAFGDESSTKFQEYYKSCRVWQVQNQFP